MSDDVFLVTGAMGCVGAWITRQLLDEGTRVVTFDASDDTHRLRLLLGEDELTGVERRIGDIRDREAVASAVRSTGATRVVHLAALTVLPCRADPVLGAQVDVLGTINVFEAAKASGGQVRGVSYASTVAVFGTADRYDNGVARDDDVQDPATLYGVYKAANEATARVYSRDHGLPSVGLRPCVVYGPGRDQGLTSETTVAMVAAAAGRPYRIRHGGSSVFQFAPDAAAAFIAAARAADDKGRVLNLGGPQASVPAMVAAIEAAVPEARGLLTHDEEPLPFPSGMDATGLDGFLGPVAYTPLQEGVALSVERFRSLLASGAVGAPGA